MQQATRLCRRLCSWPAIIALTIGCQNDTTTDSGDISDSSVQTPEDTSTQEPEDPSPIDAELHVSGEGIITLETLSESIETGQSLGDHRFWLHDSGQVWYRDESSGDNIDLGAATTADGIRLDATRSLFAIDGSLSLYDGQWLLPSPLSDLLPIPVENLTRGTHAIWLQGAGRLYRYAEPELLELSLDDNSEIRSLVTSPNGLVAIAVPELILVDSLQNPFVIADHRMDLPVAAMAIDKTNVLWVSAGDGHLHQRAANGQWRSLSHDSAITEIEANPLSGDLWLQTETGTLHHRDGVFHVVELPDGQWQGVDDYGRLLIGTDSGLLRASLGRPVVAVGLSHHAAVQAPTEVKLLPTGTESIDAISAWVGDYRLEVEDEPLRTLIDPSAFVVGEHALRLVAEGQNGSDITEIPFLVGALPDAKWADDVAPLMNTHCLACHGELATIPLHTAELWRQNIDAVITAVSDNLMPLGGPYLTTDDILLIRGWKNGGFQ